MNIVNKTQVITNIKNIDLIVHGSNGIIKTYEKDVYKIVVYFKTTIKEKGSDMEMNKEILGILKVIQTEIIGIKEDIVGIKKEIVGIKEDIVGIKEEIVGIKEDIVGIKEDIVGIKEDIVGIKKEMTNLELRLNKRIDNLIEKNNLIA